MSKKPVVLMILDGFGLTNKVDGNAVSAANKPNLDNILKISSYSIRCQWNGCRPSRRSNG